MSPYRPVTSFIDRPPVDSCGDLMRTKIRQEVELIRPLDELEEISKADVLAWADSGEEIFRLEKPAVPPKHLVSYVAVVDGEYILLVDHINAELWLPAGWHVEPSEHPRETALREVKEELTIDGELLSDQPLFLTVTETIGKTAGHTDASLWYALRSEYATDPIFDKSEFRSVRWFHKDDVPLDRSDPHMAKFMKKLSLQ